MSFSIMNKNITRGQVLQYLFMPQIWPRINDLTRTGFASLAYMIALVYRAVNILPAGHPILQPANRRFMTLRNVLAAAGSELTFSRKHIDQIIIYFAILLGLVLLALQFVSTIAYVMINPALAQEMPKTYGEFFSTPKQDTDVAYQLLFTVFGVPDLFKSGGARTEFHVALHSLFQLYSIGLLVVAVIITCYFIFAIVVETAQTGVPFGKRYNHVWTPIRLVFALGLLIPIGYGLNAGQWIALYAAKFGSDFATEGWIKFNDKMTEAYLKDPKQRVGKPQAPDLMPLVSFMFLQSACDFSYSAYYGSTDTPKEIFGYLVKGGASDSGSTPPRLNSKSYEEAVKYFDNGDIVIRFGEYSSDKHKGQISNVFPYCGELIIYSGDAKEPGAKQVQQFYYDLVSKMYSGSTFEIQTHAENYIKRYAARQDVREANAPEPPTDYKAKTAEDVDKQVDQAIEKAVDAQAESPSWQKDAQQIADLGWGGAGLWYNKIAQINGSLASAVYNVPQVRTMPYVMEYVKSKQLQQNRETNEQFETNQANDRQMEFNEPTAAEVAEGLKRVYTYWTREDIRQGRNSSQTRKTDNILIDTINAIFGTRGLFDMCNNTDVHPLAQLSILGKGLIEASIRNLALATGLGFIGTLAPSYVGIAAFPAASMLMSIATITVTMGFVLFYVLPFMPFLYFFFGVGGWIKGLFEAMVGLPLWALAHLRIDGEGLPGDAAMTGYFLIFEIFLRPILLIFGLLASIVIFAAMVKVLNEIFYLVVTNLSGHDPEATTLCGNTGAGTGAGTGTASGSSSSPISYFRGPIDELFYTVLYAIIVYMIGMSCFKLIDLVPNNILRYMGADARTFNDTAGDVSEGVMSTITASTGVVSSNVIGVGKNLGTSVGKGVEGIASMATPPKPPNKP